MGEQQGKAVDFVGNVLGALGTSTGATGATDDTISPVSNESRAAGGSEAAHLPSVDPAQIRVVFFDLDGTLLPMDLDAFLGSYFSAIGAYVAAQGLDVNAFAAGFAQGTKAMAHHGTDTTNCQAFWDEFFRHVDESACDWSTVLTHFYEKEFPNVGTDVIPNPACSRAVDALKAKGYPLVLATMPYFPPMAVEERLKWANIDGNAFARITHFENSRAAKPSPHYYAEQLAACGVSGDEVLMVGNNTVEDGVFTQLGAHLYLATDWLLNPDGSSLADIPHGTMEEFADWVEKLSPCANPASAIDGGLIDEAACRAILEQAR